MSLYRPQLGVNHCQALGKVSRDAGPTRSLSQCPCGIMGPVARQNVCARECVGWAAVTACLKLNRLN